MQSLVNFTTQMTRSIKAKLNYNQMVRVIIHMNGQTYLDLCGFLFMVIELLVFTGIN